MRRLGLVPLLLVACSDDLAKPEVIANLRVLAIRSEPPSGVPGTRVELDALVVTPDESTAVERAWFACVAAPGASAAECLAGVTVLPPCDSDPEARACLLGGDDTATYTLPQAALEGRAAGEDGQLLIGLLAAEVRGGGVAGCLQAFVDNAAVPEPCRVAAKRVQVLGSAAAVRNENPAIAGLNVNGENLRLDLAAGAAEMTEEGPEKLFFSWFVTAGEIDAFRTDLDGGDSGLSNRWMPADATGRVVVVVRDGRGGESWVVAMR